MTADSITAYSIAGSAKPQTQIVMVAITPPHTLASFPGRYRLQFLMACSILQAINTASHQKLEAERPGNEATHTPPSIVSSPDHLVGEWSGHQTSKQVIVGAASQVHQLEVVRGFPLEECDG